MKKKLLLTLLCLNLFSCSAAPEDESFDFWKTFNKLGQKAQTAINVSTFVLGTIRSVQYLKTFVDSDCNLPNPMFPSLEGTPVTAYGENSLSAHSCCDHKHSKKDCDHKHSTTSCNHEHSAADCNHKHSAAKKDDFNFWKTFARLQQKAESATFVAATVLHIIKGPQQLRTIIQSDDNQNPSTQLGSPLDQQPLTNPASAPVVSPLVCQPAGQGGGGFSFGRGQGFKCMDATCTDDH